MSLQVEIAFSVPKETARVALAAFPKGNVYMTMRDQLGTLYEDPQFAALFPRRVSPPRPPGGWPWSPSCSSLRTSPTGRPPMPSAAALTGSGYKVHLTETCDADTPHLIYKSLITHVQTTPATTQDSDATPLIHADLARADLLPKEHLADAGYVNGPLLAQSRRQYGVELVGPVARDGSWQAAGQGYDTGAFAVDWAAQQATCRQGKVSRYWQPQTDGAGNAVIHVQFSRTDCKACASQALCTHAKAGRRELHIRPQEEYLALQEARSRQKTPEFQTRYRARAGIEGTLSQGIATSGMRRSRYLGEARTHFQHVATATALNVLRMVSWLTQTPRVVTRQSRFAAFCHAV